MTSERQLPLEAVEKYYTEKLKTYGPTPLGVDWNGPDSQYLRFRQLARIIDTETPFTLNDLGCGYGAFFDYIKATASVVDYVGVDVSEAMVHEARSLHVGPNGPAFEIGKLCSRTSDYTVASGIFNVRLEEADESWWEYLCDTLRHMNEMSRMGFSFNCLTSFADPDRMRPYLYYADPCRVFTLCKKEFSRNVALLHDYDLYEFTVLVRKEEYFKK